MRPAEHANLWHLGSERQTPTLSGIHTRNRMCLCGCAWQVARLGRGATESVCWAFCIAWPKCLLFIMLECKTNKFRPNRKRAQLATTPARSAQLAAHRLVSRPEGFRCLSQEPLLATPNVFAAVFPWLGLRQQHARIVIDTDIPADSIDCLWTSHPSVVLTFSPLISSSSSTSADTFWACRSTPGLSSTSQVRVGRGLPPSLTQARFSSEFSFTGTKRLLASRRRPSISRYGGLGRSVEEVVA